jgi:hypothetical protein
MTLARGRRRVVLTAALAELQQIKAKLDATIAVVEAELLHETRPMRTAPTNAPPCGV